ncbi:MAG: hypothetical protein ACNYPH_04580 [Gammaproteobacteria bacterium WSBS_2016_MAG_OTU1]
MTMEKKENDDSELDNQDNRTNIEKTIGSGGLGIIGLVIAFFPAIVIAAIFYSITEIKIGTFGTFILMFLIRPFVMMLLRAIFENIEKK